LISRILLAIVLSIVLVGCDGRIGFGGAASAVENSSGRKLARGLAISSESINEDPDKTENRRDLVESVAERQGLNLSDDLGEIIDENKHYRNVVFREVDAGIQALPIAFVEVEFDVDGDYNVQLRFLIEQTTMLGFIHLSKLPAFTSGKVMKGEVVVPIISMDLFTLLLSKNQDALKDHLDEKWNALQAAQLAAAAAKLAAEQEAAVLKKAACEREVYYQGIYFEVDPSLSDNEKTVAIKAFEDEQRAKVDMCVKR
jgi:hypothetical protein